MVHAYENSPNLKIYTLGGPKTVLTAKSPDMTHAEWAIHNMSQSPGQSGRERDTFKL